MRTKKRVKIVERKAESIAEFEKRVNAECVLIEECDGFILSLNVENHSGTLRAVIIYAV